MKRKRSWLIGGFAALGLLWTASSKAMLIWRLPLLLYHLPLKTGEWLEVENPIPPSSYQSLVVRKDLPDPKKDLPDPREKLSNPSLHPFYGINWRDDAGYTALDYLILHKDCTPAHIDLFVKWGANVESCFRRSIKDDIEIFDTYKWAIGVRGESPPEPELRGSFFDKQCLANKEVMEHLFWLILTKKLERHRDFGC